MMKMKVNRTKEEQNRNKDEKEIERCLIDGVIITFAVFLFWQLSHINLFF